MSYSPDFWLTPVQALYFLVTGANLADVARLSEYVITAALGRLRSASIPLSADAGPEERTAAVEAH